MISGKEEDATVMLIIITESVVAVKEEVLVCFID